MYGDNHAMLKRSITNKLIEWKNSSGHHPLVLRGLRQTGKTYIVKKFGTEHYKNVIYLDLRANNSIHTAFDGDFDVDNMILSISSAIKGAKFIPGETLLILDEIQNCPNARSSLKYWDIDGRFDVIATGSFLGIRCFRNTYKRGVPVGYEDIIDMHPMTFIEFLENIGVSNDVLRHIDDSIAETKPINTTVHDSIRRYYLQYLIVGGMPEAVNTFIETHDINQVQRVQQRIIRSIRDDFGRYADSAGNDKINETLKLRADACLDSLPSQLAKDYKKFQYSLVNVKGHSPEKAKGLQYLVDLGLIYKAYNINEISTPLEGRKKDNEFKAYMADTGLLTAMLEHGTAAHILNGDLSSYKGAIAENMVSSAFAAYDIPQYYYHAPSGSPELDFIFSNNGEATIIECKSNNNRATSMKYVLDNPKKYGAHPAIKLADSNIGNSGKYLTYPIYALPFILNKLNDPMIISTEEVNGAYSPD